MQFEHQGRRFDMIRASDLQHDGLSLELSSDSRPVAEVFYSNVTGEFAISVFEQHLPLAVIEHLINAAQASLPPSSKLHGL